MKLLAIDTATEACSVALNLDGEVLEHFEMLPRRHSRELLPMVESLLKQHDVRLADMDALAFGRGPGAFTGLRVATAMVQGLAYAVDKPVIGVSTLRALAQEGFRTYGASSVAAAIDARMGEVYWGVFREENGVMTAVEEEQVLPPADVSLPEGNDLWLGMGTGWNYREEIAVEVFECHPETYPRAGDIAFLAAADFKEGLAVPAEQAMPIYLRDKVALKKSER